MNRGPVRPLLLLLGLAFVELAGAGPARIAIIVDDLGFRYAEGVRAVNLPGRITCAVIPNAPHAVAMARAAHQRGKEVLLHLPMQPVDPARAVGEQGLTIDTTRVGVRRLLRAGLAGVPYASGVNNHMGSLITRHPGHMTWLMQELAREQLFFVDSVTTLSSVALSMAHEQGVPALKRDLFLDRDDMTEEQVEQRLDKLLALARRRGYAVGIAHPFPATMAVLERRLEALEASGIKLVPVSELVAAPAALAAARAVADRGLNRHNR